MPSLYIALIAHFLQCVQLIVVRQESSGYEFRVKSLNEELTSLRAALQERESTISKLRIEVHESTDRASQSLAQVILVAHSKFFSLGNYLSELKHNICLFCYVRNYTYNVQTYEVRLKSLMDELSTVRKSLLDRDTEVSQLRIQLHDATAKIIVVKVCCMFGHFFWKSYTPTYSIRNFNK